MSTPEKKLAKKLTVCNKLGIHARAAAKLVKIAARYVSTITITANNKTANAKSIMGVMLLAASKGTEITFTIEGPEQDAMDAMTALSTYICDKCEENE